MIPDYIKNELTSIHDSNGDLIWISPAWKVEPSLVLGSRWEEFMAPDDAMRFRSYFSSPEKFFESRGMLASTGEEIEFLVAKRPIGCGMWLGVFLVTFCATVSPALALQV